MAALLSSRIALVPRSTSISTGAIVGATIGSVIGAALIFLCALPFILRARRLRAFRRQHGDDAAIEEFGQPDFLSRSHFGDALRRLSHSTPAQPPPKTYAAGDGQESTDQHPESVEKPQTTLYPTGISVHYGLPSPISPSLPAATRLPGRALQDGRTATGSITLATQTTQDSVPTQMLSREPTVTEAGTSFAKHSISDSFAAPSRQGTFGSKGITDEPESLGQGGKPGHKRRSSHLSDSVRQLAQRASAALRRDSTMSTGSIRSPPLAPSDDLPTVASAPATFEPVDTDARGEAYSYYHGFDDVPEPEPVPLPHQTATYGPPISIPAPSTAPLPRSTFTSPTSVSTVTPISPVSPGGPSSQISPLTSRPTFGLGQDGADNVYEEPDDFRPPSLREKRGHEGPLKRMDTQPLKPIVSDIPSPPLPAKSEDSVNPMAVWDPTTTTEKDFRTLVELSTPSPPTRPQGTPPMEPFPSQPTPDATPEPELSRERDVDMEEDSEEESEEESEPELKQEPYTGQGLPPPQIAIDGGDIDMIEPSGRYTPPASSIPSNPTTPGYISDPHLTPGPSLATPSPRSNEGPSEQSDSSPRLYKCDECHRVFDQYHKLK
ncbi:hypothetical protein CONLIGDRAFT_313394 [Coniochaeta ligniaria NRRL 30616]|uniref:Uncharacterized protein n=1 Tax=Coniochaeta ligniaria NRRL 30616 TaxID=1408157 RepID=A0A1J7IVM5_9PEZI|nr:hypothetical protein CONLIGDRAFT_313394 [Coniochaeta ligniaria NRRL 30616]